MKTYVVTPHLNCLIEPVQMRGSQHIVLMRNKNDPSSIIKYSLLSRALFIYGNSESKADKILFCLRSKVQIISYLNEKKRYSSLI